ncbi:MAG TPA: MFS transporter, partial [Nitratifractor sp.]|nr:MFS transporter [Nitratifractor sp.]
MKKVERNLKLIEWIQITQSMIFVASVLVPYFQFRGLEFSEILLLQSIFAIASMVLEFPSGYLSDKFGRKKTLNIAYFALCLAVFIFYMGSSFAILAFAELTFALGYSLVSGTVSALLYESLEELKRVDEYSKILGANTHKALLTVALSGIVGGVIAHFISLRVTVALTLIAFSVSFVLSFILVEVKEIKKRGISDDIKDFKSIVSNSELIYIATFVSMIFAFNQVSFWYYQPYFKAVGVELFYFGFIFASFQMVASIGSKYAHKVQNKFTSVEIFKFIAVMIVISLFGMGWSFSLFGLAFVYLQQLVRGFFFVLVDSYM